MAAFGIDPAENKKDEEHFYVHNFNWLPWSIFLQCQNQWHSLAGAQGQLIRTGLDLSAVVAVIGLHKPKKPKAVLRAVILIQQGALAAMNKIPLERLFGE